MTLRAKPLSEQTAVVTGGGTGIGRAFAGALAGEGEEPRPGFVHVSNMARTLLYALSLDRNVVLEDISLYAR